MDEQTLARLMGELRFADGDSQQIEVKEAVGGLPSSIPETISAFSNGSGGTVVLGVSERNGFHAAAGFRAKAIAEALAQVCRDRLTPAIQPDISVIPFDDSPVVVAVIPEMNPQDKPCHVTTQGMYAGSYIRVSDGDRKLTAYEIDRLLEERRQPRHDRAIVQEATKTDLREDLVRAVLEGQRASHPRVFASMEDDDALRALGILANDSTGVLRPTLAGLLALGRFPQQFFPRLTVSFASYPGLTKADARGIKYTDSLTAAGPVCDILSDILDIVRRNMRVGGTLAGGFRRNLPEYPLDAVREAVVNAIMHRDYSHMAQGSQIQVNLYADRLEVLSPGGLYGVVTVENLGESGVSATRNMTLSSLLEVTPFAGGYVAENRGTGFQLMTALLEGNGNGRAEVRDSLSLFRLTFHSNVARHEEENRHGRARIYRMPVRPSAPNLPELSDTFDDDSMSGGADAFTQAGFSPAEAAMLAFIARHSPALPADLARNLGIPRSTVTYQLRKLLADGVIERTQPSRSPKQSYRIRRSA